MRIRDYGKLFGLKSSTTTITSLLVFNSVRSTIAAISSGLLGRLERLELGRP
jgi:hypothetical protein